MGNFQDLYLMQSQNQYMNVHFFTQWPCFHCPVATVKSLKNINKHCRQWQTNTAAHTHFVNYWWSKGFSSDGNFSTDILWGGNFIRVDSVPMHLSQDFLLSETSQHSRWYLAQCSMLSTVWLFMCFPMQGGRGEGREFHVLLKVLFDTPPSPHFPAQLILSLGYYQEGAWQSGMTGKTAQKPEAWGGN